ncbi:MAG TPA: 50S ribosomal protein L25 [Gemmatimonadales bacterium]|nr:50S ribosomal protein L25 [Gemmatimonadales bacterium]
MSQNAQLDVARRTSSGKGAARSLRRLGQLPGVIYGRGRESLPITIEAAALQRLLARGGSSSTLFEVSIDSGEPVQTLIRELQRDPLRPEHILHIDLYEVHAGEKIELSVPIHLVGTAEGVRNEGGVLDHALRELDIKVLPRDIPKSVDLDVTALTIGDALYVRDIQLGDVEIMNDPDIAVCSVVAPRAIEEPVAVEAAEGIEVVAEGEAAPEPELIRKPKPEEETEEP